MNTPVVGTLQSIGATSRARPGLTSVGMAGLVLGILALVVSLASGRPEIAALAVPPIVAIVLAMAAHAGDRFAVSISAENDRFVEGDTVTYTIGVSSTVGLSSCRVALRLAAGMEAVAGSTSAVVSVLPGVPRVIRVPVTLSEWGVTSPAALEIRVVDAFRMLTRDYDFSIDCPVRVSVHDERLRSMAEPDRYRRITGGHLSPDRGDGTELADVREYQRGDPLRWVNWRISNRRGEPWVTVRHPDRSTTVVLLADGFTRGPEKERAVARATQALAQAHLGVHDKVGLLVLGAAPEWIEPDLGKRQAYRITDALLDVSVARRSYERLDPTRVVPRDAVIVAVSTLDNPEFVSAVASLRSRGQTVAVLEPSFSTDELVPSSWASDPEAAAFARRLYAIERAAHRGNLRDRGLAVISWDQDEPIDVPVGQMRRLQRLSKAGP